MLPHTLCSTTPPQPYWVCHRRVLAKWLLNQSQSCNDHHKKRYEYDCNVAILWAQQFTVAQCAGYCWFITAGIIILYNFSCHTLCVFLTLCPPAYYPFSSHTFTSPVVFLISMPFPFFHWLSCFFKKLLQLASWSSLHSSISPPLPLPCFMHHWFPYFSVIKKGLSVCASSIDRLLLWQH